MRRPPEAYADFDDWLGAAARSREEELRLCMWADLARRKGYKARRCKDPAVAIHSGIGFAYGLCERHGEEFRDNTEP